MTCADVPSKEERRVDILLTVSIAACDSAAKQYEDLGKSFVALDSKAQNAATIAGVVLAAVVAFANAGKLEALISIATWWSTLFVLTPIVGALITIVVSFLASRVMDVYVPFAAEDQFKEVQDLRQVPVDELTQEHVLGYYSSRLLHWNKALESISKGLKEKARLVHVAQVALIVTLFFVLILFVVLALS